MTEADVERAHQDLIAGKLLLESAGGKYEMNGPIFFGRGGVNPSCWEGILRALRDITLARYDVPAGSERGFVRQIIVPASEKQQLALEEKLKRVVGEIQADFPDPDPEQPTLSLVSIQAFSLKNAGKQR